MQTLYPIDWAQAVRHARALGGDTRTTVQTFADNSDDRADPQRCKRLARVLHGDLLDQQFRIAVQRLHDDGAGVFITVNRTDRRGRKNRNIVAALAALLDGDLTKPGVAETCEDFWLKSQLIPSVTIESSSGNFHYYLMLTDCALAEYEAIQRMLHTRAGTDPLHDLARVLRLAGAWHRKGAPFQSRIVDIQDVSYTVAELRHLAERVSPLTGYRQEWRKNTTVENQAARTSVLDATDKLRDLFNKHNGLVKPAVRDLVQQIGADGCGRHNAIVAIAGRLVFQKWSDAQAAEFLVPIVNQAFDEGDWTKEIMDALGHARRRDQEHLGTMRTATWR